LITQNNKKRLTTHFIMVGHLDFRVT